MLAVNGVFRGRLAGIVTQPRGVRVIVWQVLNLDGKYLADYFGSCHERFAP
jgi:hypothetical protein